MDPSVNSGDFPPRLFITGTDTGIGKTVIAAVLMSGLRGLYWKPIQSGLEEMTDTDWVRQKTGLAASHFHPEAYRLPLPASPHLAAARAGTTIDFERLSLPSAAPGRTLLIEGAGGVMVPVNEQQLISDLILYLDVPALVVAPARLGMINHTLLTIAHLRDRRIPVFGVIINQGVNFDYQRAIETYGRVPVLGQVDVMREINPATLRERFNGLKPGLLFKEKTG